MASAVYVKDASGKDVALPTDALHPDTIAALTGRRGEDSYYRSSAESAAKLDALAQRQRDQARVDDAKAQEISDARAARENNPVQDETASIGPGGQVQFTRPAPGAFRFDEHPEALPPPGAAPLAAAPQSAIPITNGDPALHGGVPQGAAPPPGTPPMAGSASYSVSGPGMPGAYQGLGLLGQRSDLQNMQAQRDLNANAHLQNTAIDNQTARAQRDAGAMQAMIGEKAKEAAAGDAAIAKNAGERDAFMSAKQQQLDGMITQVQQSKIDPNRYWANKSTASKIGAGVATVLSGIFSGLGNEHGPNRIWTQINHEIDQDIEAQVSDRNNLKDAVNMQHNLVSMARQNFTDTAQSKVAAKMAALSLVDAKIDQYQAMSKGQGAADNAALLKAKVNEERIKTAQTFNQSANQQAYQVLSTRGTMEEKAAAAAKEKAEADLSVGGTSGQVQNSRMVGRGVEEVQKFAGMEDAVNQLIKYRALRHGAPLGGADQRKMETLTVFARDKLKADLGVSEDTAKRMIPDPTEWGHAGAALDQTLEIISGQKAGRLRPLNLTPRGANDIPGGFVRKGAAAPEAEAPEDGEEGER